MVNTFTVQTPFALAAVPGEISTALAAFYTATGTDQVNPLSYYLGNKLSRAADACRVRLFNVSSSLDGSAHGPSYFEDTFTLGAPSASNCLPPEVALVATIYGAGRESVSPEVADNADPSGFDDADSLRDRPMQRRTGRIYLGPFTLNAFDGATAGPNDDVRQDLAYAFRNLQNALEARSTGPYMLSVWSRKNQSIYNAYSVSVDNAFDTQRRRGFKPTASFRVDF